jgi:hypothetical protein
LHISQVLFNLFKKKKELKEKNKFDKFLKIQKFDCNAIMDVTKVLIG